MKIMLNALSAKRGGAVSYLSNVLPELSKQLAANEETRVIVWQGAAPAEREAALPGVEYRLDPNASGKVVEFSGWRRLWFDQVKLPKIIRREGVNVLFSTANFGTIRCPCRQVLLVRNTLFFDPIFAERVKAPKVRMRFWLQRRLALRSIKSADVTLFPSKAIMDMVAKYISCRGRDWRVAPYGVRHDMFQPVAKPQEKNGAALRLLNVSLYSDQKNLGTFLRAAAKLHKLEPHRYYVQLTAGFDQERFAGNPLFPDFVRDRELYCQLQAEGVAEDMGPKSYHSLPGLYQQADVFVFPSYTESFGHPLVEAMASGIPVVAADVAVNREICGDAAVYFSPLNVDACMDAIRKVAADSQLRAQLRTCALARSRTFTWENHAADLIKAFRE